MSSYPLQSASHIRVEFHMPLRYPLVTWYSVCISQPTVYFINMSGTRLDGVTGMFRLVTGKVIRRYERDLNGSRQAKGQVESKLWNKFGLDRTMGE